MIISASRRTDIPAFYSNWFMNRVRDGFVLVRNPLFKKIVTKVILDPEKVDAIVFWTKNPQLMLEKLPELDNRGFFYYFLFTVTPYGNKLEPNIPENKHIVDTFHHLSEMLGADRVIWRYDPIVISDLTDDNYHIERFFDLASSLKGYTKKCITSFMVTYKKCIRNMQGFKVENHDPVKKAGLLNSLKQVADNFNISLQLCADENSIDGIEKSCCIDNQLIAALTGKDLKYKKDPSQRIHCHCAESIDIGAYNTCLHNCLYCYANYDSSKVKETIADHKISSPMLIGEPLGTEQIKSRI
jgi:hypothetical protein